MRYCFLLSHFLVVEDYELSQSTSHLLSVPLSLECVRILSLFISFSSTSIVSLMMFCVRLLSELMILSSAYHVISHLTCHNKLRLSFDLKNKNCWKISLFFICCFLILKCQNLVLKVIYSSTDIKSYYS